MRTGVRSQKSEVRILALVLAASAMCGLCHAALMPIEWIADGDENAPKIITIAQGETRDLVPTLRNYGAPVVIPDTATATLHYQTNGMGRSWWSGHTATVTTAGVVTATWTPDLDCGASTYTFAIGVKDGSNTLYTAYGLIRMRTSPGWVVNEAERPWRSLDFATLDIANAPWATPEEVTNIVTAIGGTGGGGIGEEADPIAYPVATQALATAQAALPVIYNSIEDTYYMDSSRSLFIPESNESTMNGAGIWNVGFYIRSESEVVDGGMDMSWIDRDGFWTAWGGGTETYSIVRGGWPDTSTKSPLIKRDELAATNVLIRAAMAEALEGIVVEEDDPLSVHTSGGAMTGLLTLSSAGVALYGSGTTTNYIIKAEYDGTNVSFNVYEVSR